MSIGMKRGVVYLERHQEIWEENARQVIRDIKTALGGVSVAAEHIGSTSIKAIKSELFDHAFQL